MNKTLMIVGNGAVENGWAPVDRAISSTLSEKKYTSSELFLASLYFKISIILHDFIQKKNSENVDRLIKFTSEYNFLIAQIEKEFTLSISRGEVRLRKNLLLKSFHHEAVDIVTTNWERTLSNEFHQKKINYIHGSIATGDLYLPTSSTSDFSYVFNRVGVIEKRYCERLSTLKPENYAMILKILSVGNKSLSSKFPFILLLLNNSVSNVIFWGIGMNTYDSELISILESFIVHSDSVRNVLIIDPSKATESKIRNIFRVNSRINVYSCNPNDKKSLRNARSIMKKVF